MEDGEGFILYKDRTSLRKIFLSDIDYIESDRHNIVVHTEGQTYSFRGKLSDIEEALDKRMFRINRSFIINMDRVVFMEGGTTVFTDGNIINMSKAMFSSTRRAILSYFDEI